MAETFSVVDKRRLPMMISPELAFQEDLSFTHIGVLFWLLACENKGYMDQVFESYKTDSYLKELLDELDGKNFIRITERGIDLE